MGDESVESGGLQFDNIFPMSTGFVTRQTRNNDPGSQIFTWQYHAGCTSEITVPLNSVRLSSPDSVDTFLEGYEQRQHFIQMCYERNLRSGWLIDLSQLFSVLMGIMKRQEKLMDAENLAWPLFLKIQITSVLRRVPFLDMPEVIQFMQTHGIPVIQQDQCFAPAGTEPDNCLELRHLKDVPGGNAHIVDACIALAFICQAMGLPRYVLGIGETVNTDTLTRMLVLGNRAAAVTRQRNGKLR